VVDFYGNGKTQVVLVGTHANGSNTSLLSGASNGTLTETPLPNIPGGNLAIADVNGDGKPDVIAAESCTTIASSIDVLLNGSSAAATSTVADICVAPGATLGFTQAAAADMNGDGIPDLLLSDGSGLLYVFAGKGDGTFAGAAAGQFYTGASPAFNPSSGFDVYGSITTADFRGTGKRDVAMALAGKGVVLLENSAGAAPQLTAADVVSAATLTPQPAVAGSLTSLFGPGLSYQTGTGVYSPNVLPNWLFGTTVTLNGTAVPIMWISPTQANIQIPWEDAGLTQATMVVTRNGLASQAVTIPLAPAAPGLFAMNGQGTGQAAAVTGDSAAIAAPVGAFPGSQPALAGQYVSFYGTGLGAVTEPAQLIDGEATPTRDAPFQPFTPIYFPTLQTATVTIGGMPATVQFAGLAPAMIGVYQVNVLIPANAPAGAAVPVQLSIGGVKAPVVTIAIGPL
jgi:uncharacterized protein (TIGR03437 family)